jgi:electron transfer flavoprotein alpha subunit
MRPRRSPVCPRCSAPRCDEPGPPLAEPTADLIVSLAGDYSHIVAPATSDAKNIMPRVAALLDVMVISDASGVVDADTFERPIYAGNACRR